MPTTAEVRTVAVGGQRLRVAITSGPNGPGREPRIPLLLINGIGASLEALEPFVTALDGAVEVIRFDPPGVGGSPLPPGPYRFTGLCLADRRDADRTRPRPGRRAAALLDRAYLERVAGDLYGGSARTDWAAASTALHGPQRNGPSRGYFYQLGAVAGWTGVPFLPWLRQPALILAGDDDPIIPLANARLMHRLIRGSRLHVYPGGHLGLLTEAAGLAPVVDGFLSAP